MINIYKISVIGLGLIMSMAISRCSSQIELNKNKLSQEWYSKAVELEPQPTQDEWERAENLQLALVYLNKAIELDPQFPEAQAEKEAILRKIDNIDDAIKTPDKVLELNPKSAKAWYSKAYKLGFSGSGGYRGSWPAEEVLKYLNKAIELDPQFGQAWYLKGVTLARPHIRNTEEAIRAFDKAIELSPQAPYVPVAWLLKARELAATEKPEEAIKAYNKVIEFKGLNYQFALGEEGEILLALKRYDESIETFDKYIEAYPRSHYGWYYRAVAYSGKKDRENTLSDLTKAISLNPEYKEKTKKDEAFQWLKDDEDFKKLTQ